MSHHKKHHCCHEKHGSPHDHSCKEGEEAEPTKEETPPSGMITVSSKEFEELKKQLEESKDKYLRQLAEMENARKRLQKERQEMIQFATEQVIVDFLPPLDNLENALRAANNLSDELKNWAAGFQMILMQFKDVLAGQGVTAVPSVGAHFDADLHDAVEAVETDKSAPGTVVEECVPGYKMGDRTIRPARVKVAKAKA